MPRRLWRACPGTGRRCVPILAHVLQEGFAVLGERTRCGRCRSRCSSFRLHAFRAVQRTSAAFNLVDDNRHQRCTDATTTPHSGHFSLDQEQGEEGLTFSERLADSKPSPEEVCSIVEARNRLVEGVQRLSPKLRRTFQLRDIDGLTTKEAAHVLGVPQGTVKAQLARARAQLAGIMRGKPVRQGSRTAAVGQAVSKKGAPSQNLIWIPVSGPFGLTPRNKGNKEEFL